MNRAFRLLPALGVGLLVIFAVRAGEIWTGVSTAGKAWAEDAAKPKADASAPKAQPVVPVDHTPMTAPPGAAPTDAGLPALNPPAETAQAAPAAAPVATADAVAAPSDAPPKGARPQIPGEESFTSPAEIEVLESLTRRREDLDKREAALDMREKLLQTTEQRLDQKLAEVQKVQADIKTSVRTLNDQEAAQIASLVKVYEAMKPKEAAAIFQGLDRTILIDVSARMREAKMSAILAAMDPEKAREVTVMLAKRTQIPGLGTTGATAANP